jgi:hypothetical protein
MAREPVRGAPRSVAKRIPPPVRAPMDVIRAATDNAAELLGLLNCVGTLEPAGCRHLSVFPQIR